ncbi:MAG: flagellar hook-associated protein FlgK [Lachnospiraceae bacterium]|nr:flagellar hook-associated protein FlgK [Lachnospiraceae bacterium]
MAVGSMSGLYIGASGLMTNQNALNTTAHNLANVDTQGYSRQQVLLGDALYVNLRQGNNNNDFFSGTGTHFIKVRQVRDQFLDAAYRDENGRLSFYNAQANALTEVEYYFAEMDGSTFSDNLSNFRKSVEELKKNSLSLATRGSLVSAAVSVMNQAKEIHSQLKDYQLNLNDEIQSRVDRINEIAEEILDLNKKISRAESNQIDTANDLRDSRNLLLDELSSYIDISTKEEEDGSVLVFAEGLELVSEIRTFKMGTAPEDGNDDLVKPIWLDYDNMDVFNFDRIPSISISTDVGELKGLMMARGGITPNYTDIPVEPENATEEEMIAYNEACDKYNQTIEPYAIANIIAEFDQLVHGIVTTINDILCPNVALEGDVTLADGTTLAAGTMVLDVANAPVGQGEGNNIPGTELFSRKGYERYEKVTAADGTEYYVFQEEDTNNYDSLYTADRLEINPDVLQNYNLLPLSDLMGGENQKVLDELLSKWDSAFATLNPNSDTPCDFQDYYKAMVDEFANKCKSHTKMVERQSLTVNDVDTQRQQTIGTSSDEELTNLIKFQQAYNASSRYVTVVSEMLEHIIERLGA